MLERLGAARASNRVVINILEVKVNQAVQLTGSPPEDLMLAFDVGAVLDTYHLACLSHPKSSI